ncbi:MAG: LON peptidase substrate-binding domain-containing protein, partial [Phycisphaeraceae bacterium]|nr:LON peptidase substrate-binding domain-containing protein [Phycisphaeraceae bacterium]
MSGTVTIDFRRPIPLFPLPTCVLLPHATIPLHIFEPRYRRMVAETMRERRLIAMATFEGTQWQTEYEGSPPLRPCVCVGYILRDERLADGRFNILLQGLCRAKIVREPWHEPYRLGLLEPVETQQAMEIDLEDQRKGIEHLLADPTLKDLAAVSAIQNWLSDEIPTTALVDLAAMTFCENLEQRYQLLEEADVQARAQWLLHMLQITRRTMHMA